MTKQTKTTPPARHVQGLPLSRPATMDDITDMARQYGSLAIDTLVDVARSSSLDSARVSAANSLLDRGYGKVSQHLEVSGKLDLIQAIEEGRKRAQDRG